MAPFASSCPVDERERAWIQESITWFRDQFGDEPLHRPVVLPTHDYFPPPFSGSDAEVLAMVRKVSGYMAVQRQKIRVKFTNELDHAAGVARLVPALVAHSQGAAEAGDESPSQETITIERPAIRDPAKLVAVIAHELGHVRLLGEHRISMDREDSEPLTDLATVYLGMGVFTANAAFDFGGNPRLRRAARLRGLATGRTSYLTRQMSGYGLACLAWLREEPDPAWAKFLDTSPRGYLKQGLRYLKQNSSPGAFPPAA